MRFYSHFSLLMVRSPGFGSMATNFLRPIQTWFPFGSDASDILTSLVLVDPKPGDLSMSRLKEP